MAAIKLTRTHRVLITIVLAGAVVIAAIGFVGSYAAVRDLAERKGFGEFAPFFPIGIDAGIVVLLSLDLLLTWLRIPFPLLRQTAWLLTAATVAFNGAAAWGDPLAVGMHAIIPVLFIITVEAARHAIGRITDIAADRHMEGVRLWRWVLSPIPTFRLWRRMKLWELRSYQEVIDLERDRLVYRARLRAQYGRGWRRRAPVEARLPLKLAHLGVPLDTGRALEEPAAALPRPTRVNGAARAAGEPSRYLPAETGTPQRADQEPALAPQPPAETTEPAAERAPEPAPVRDQAPARAVPAPAPVPEPEPEPAPVQEQLPQVTVPVGPGRRRALTQLPQAPQAPEAPEEPAAEEEPVGLPEDVPREQVFYGAFVDFLNRESQFPNARQLSRHLHEQYGIGSSEGSLLSEGYLRGYLREFKDRYRAEAGTAV